MGNQEIPLILRSLIFQTRGESVRKIFLEGFPGVYSPQLMPLASGTQLGPYEITAPLGAGGMGEVYRARDTRLDRTVAIEILPAHFSNDPGHKQRFER
jgi:serine/threonine protein kinase